MSSFDMIPKWYPYYIICIFPIIVESVNIAIIIIYNKKCAWIFQKKIFDGLYGKNSHSELLQRSTDIFRFLLNEDQLQREQLEQIWTSLASWDLERQKSMFKIFIDTASQFSPAQITFFIEMLQQQAPEKLTVDQLELIKELIYYGNKHT